MSGSYSLGIDVGGTKTELVLLQRADDGALVVFSQEKERHAFREVARERILTERVDGYDRVLRKISQFVKEFCKKNAVSEKSIHSVGIGLPGSIHPQTQKMISGNTLILVDRNFAQDLQRELGWSVPFFSENDANCFALAEVLCGVGKVYEEKTGIPSHRTLGVGVILGTGCGGGIVFNGQLINGRNGSGGEIGHMVFVEDGPSCYCGRSGCPEQYLSGPGLEALFNSRKSVATQNISSAEEIFTQAAQGEPTAVAVVAQYRRLLARFLGGLNSVLNPDFFVLGGGVSKQLAIYQGLEAEAMKNSFIPSQPLSVFQSKLGDSSGVLGAALLPFLK